MCVTLFFINDTATTEIYTLSLHDALPISDRHLPGEGRVIRVSQRIRDDDPPCGKSKMSHLDGLEPDRSARFCRQDRKSTRLNSSHANISYAVFCLKKKKCTVRPLCFG